MLFIGNISKRELSTTAFLAIDIYGILATTQYLGCPCVVHHPETLALITLVSAASTRNRQPRPNIKRKQQPVKIMVHPLVAPPIQTVSRKQVTFHSLLIVSHCVKCFEQHRVNEVKN